MKRYTPDTSTNNYVVPEYSDAVDGPGAFKAFADGLDTQHIVPIKEGILSNTNLIGDNTNQINAISNRLDALENTSLSSEWTIRTDGGGPEEGEISLDSAVWADVEVLKFSLTDKNGVSHDFANVKAGDTIQIGVGPEAKAAGSSAAYTVEEVKTNGEFSVDHLASTGDPKSGFTAIVAVYPAFDPSNYATTAELDAVDAAKFDRGTGDLDYVDAVVLGQAVTENKGGIADNANTINKLLAGLNLEIDANGEIIIIGGGEVPDLNELEQDISKKFDIGTGTTNLNDATTMEAAIGQNAVDIKALVEVLGGSIDNIGDIQIDALPSQDGNDGLFLTTDGKDASWAAPKTGDIALSADASLFAELPDGSTAANQSEVNQYLATNGLFKGTMITWGHIANKTDADA